MKTIGIALLLATTLSACQPRHQSPVADEVKLAQAEPVVRDEAPKPEFSPCGTHDEIVKRAAADGMEFYGYEGGGTGTGSLIEVFNDGARKQIKVNHGPDQDCFIDPEADSNGDE